MTQATDISPVGRGCAFTIDPAELLDIDMDELTRVLPLIATDGLQLQSTQLVQA
jgi:hypothetical protein